MDQLSPQKSIKIKYKMKCEICHKRIETTFMNKIIGTYYVKGKKKYPICNECQKNNSKEDIKEKLKI
ncbi:MAG: hypothetical protein KatS3mg002_1196 [Candidatus Woesearchaeota archaeon]|nr:MAG: hypothetical protein KatS3mg002_1196 [Candidatus Woesearchaeota archaeon]